MESVFLGFAIGFGVTIGGAAFVILAADFIALLLRRRTHGRK